MNYVYIGTVIFSKVVLENLIALGYPPKAVITRKTKGNHSDYADIGDICNRYGVKCLETNNINSFESKKFISDLKPDYMMCFGWSQLLDNEILAIPSIGTIGYHPSLLPKNRGRHPIIWALVLGLSQTGSSFFFINEEVDGGEIISQRKVIVEDFDNAKTLYDKITLTAISQIEEMLPKLQMGSIIPRNENNNCNETESNIWRKRSMLDGKIDWRMSSKSIYNLIRALTKPYPGAFFMRNDNEVKVWKAFIDDYKTQDNIEPGKILEVYESNEFLIKTGDGAIKILDTTPILSNLVKGDYIL